MTITRIQPSARSSRASVHNNTVYIGGLVGTAGKSAKDQTAEVQDPARDYLA